MKLKIHRYPGKLIFRYYANGIIWYLDQLDYQDGMPYPDNPDDLPDDQFCMCQSNIGWYLNKYYNITLQQYFNLVHGLPIDESPKCKNPECSGHKRFINLQCGYTEFCTPSCGSSYNIKKQYADPNRVLKDAQARARTPEFLAELSRFFTEMNNENWDNPEYRKMKSGEAQYTINSLESKIQSTYSDFLNKGNLNDPCEFYIGFNHNTKVLKYGVTYGLYLQKLWRCNLTTVHIIFKGTRLEVADLERFIKESRSDYNEFINLSDLPSLIKLIKKFKLKLTTKLQSTSTTIP